jgi:hypothetical protein
MEMSCGAYDLPALAPEKHLLQQIDRMLDWRYSRSDHGEEIHTPIGNKTIAFQNIVSLLIGRSVPAHKKTRVKWTVLKDNVCLHLKETKLLCLFQLRIFRITFAITEEIWCLIPR